jgi:hypothetical protein
VDKWKVSNLYHWQNVDKWKVSPTSLRWTAITIAETKKKFLGLLLLMDQVRKDNLKDRSTDPTVATPVLSQTMSRNHLR